MKNKKSLYIASAFCSALTMAAANSASATGNYDEATKHCYGAALKGQNDCTGKDGVHSCKGTATTDCDANDWVLAMSQEKCDELTAKNCPPKSE